jgi:hypothetical protein
MNQLVNSLALIMAIGAALLTALAGAWRDLPVVTLGTRCLVAALLVFGFVRACGELAGRALLHGLAQHQVDREKSREQGASTEPGKRQAA